MFYKSSFIWYIFLIHPQCKHFNLYEDNDDEDALYVYMYDVPISYFIKRINTEKKKRKFQYVVTLFAVILLYFFFNQLRRCNYSQKEQAWSRRGFFSEFGINCIFDNIWGKKKKVRFIKKKKRYGNFIVSSFFIYRFLIKLSTLITIFCIFN